MSLYVNELVELKGDVIALDTETSGLNPRTSRVWCVQLADDFRQVVLTHLWRQDVLDYIRGYLSTRVIVGANLSFDIKFLWQLGLTDIYSLWDVMLVQQLLTAGLDFKYDLKSIARYYGFFLSKEERSEFYDGTLQPDTNERHGCVNMPRNLIEYAASDVKVLLPIYRNQKYRIDSNRMSAVAKLENSYLRVAANIEWRGMKLDASKSQALKTELESEVEPLGAELKDYLSAAYKEAAWREYELKLKLYQDWKDKYNSIAKNPNARGRYPKKNGKAGFSTQYHPEVRRQLDAMKKHAPENPKKPGGFNLSSTKHILLALQEKGYNVHSTSKDDIIDILSELGDIGEKLIRYRSLTTLSKILVQLEGVDETTSRLHPKIKQLLVTGRQASSSPNILAIPARSAEGKRFRNLFTPDEGNVFVYADYAAIELIILFTYSGDADALKILAEDKDLHAYTISRMFDVDALDIVARAKKGEDVDVTPLKRAVERAIRIPELNALSGVAFVSRLRDYIKTITYGVSYGLTEYGFSRRFHCDKEDARVLIQKFFEVYPKLRNYLNGLGEYASEFGMTQPIADGRYRHFLLPTMSDDDDEKEYWQQIYKIRRQAGNYVAQATCASMLKLAAIYFIKSYPVPNEDANIIAAIHDEFLVEAKQSIADRVAACLKESMEKAANVFLKNDVVKVKVQVNQQWEK